MDPISDMFIRIKNASKAGHETAQIPYSKFKHEIIKTLARAKLVEWVERKGKKTRKVLEIGLSTKDGVSTIKGVKLLSKPSRRLYAPYKRLRRAGGGGITILSTPQGVMGDQEARKAKVGGQLIAEVW